MHLKKVSYTNGSNYLFPSLIGNMEKETVTKHISDIIKMFLRIAAVGYTAKSLRYSATMYLTNRPNVFDVQEEVGQQQTQKLKITFLPIQ